MITQNIIGYDLSSKSGKKIQSYNPVAEETIYPGFEVATADEVNLAMEKAFHAWRKYRNLPGTVRGQFLTNIAAGLDDIKADLIKTIAEETGYPDARIITEFNRTTAQLRMFADIAIENAWREITIDEALPSRTPAPRPELIRMMMPIGPVVVFGASNFPLAYSTMGGDAVSALAVGCPVVIKAHESHLGTNARVAEVVMNAAKDLRLPDGVFSSLHGDGMETGKQLVLHPRTAAVGFTGSFNGGKALFDLGNRRENPIPVFAEMGSVNPIFILPGVIENPPTDLIAKLVTSMTLTVGQFCTNPGILVVQANKNLPAFIHQLTIALARVYSAPMLNKSVAKNFHQGLQKVVADKAVEMLFNQNEGGQTASPVLASVQANHFLTNPELHREIFGPYSIIIQCENSNEILSIAESIEGQLTSSVFFNPDESDLAARLTDLLTEKAGRIIHNGVPTGVEVCAAMTHGGPYPASTDSRFTAVGHYALRRWIRPVTFQQPVEDVIPDHGQR